VASYSVNERGVARARQLIEARQYVLRSEWNQVQPRAAEENAFLESHSWDEYSGWHLGLTDGAVEGTKARSSSASESDVDRSSRARVTDGPAGLPSVLPAGLVACLLPRVLPRDLILGKRVVSPEARNPAFAGLPRCAQGDSNSHPA
jgi:hypothetical protein